MKTLPFIFCLLCAIPAHADDWLVRDKILFSAFVGLQVADTLQTYEIIKHPDKFKEANPLYGNPPKMGLVIGAKAAYTGLVYYLLDTQTGRDNRTAALLVLDAIAGAIVLHNHTVGVRIEF